jgi:type 1 fimbria pilin
MKSVSCKSKSSSVVDTYTYTFNPNSTTQISIGANAGVSNLMFDLFDKDNKNVGYVMYDGDLRNVQNITYNDARGSIFLNNNKDLITISNVVLTGEGTLAADGNFTAKAIYTSGKYKNKDVVVSVSVNDTNLRTMKIISH